MFRTYKFHRCLPLVIIGCQKEPLMYWMILENLMFEAKFTAEQLYLVQVEDNLRIVRVDHWLPLVINAFNINH